MLRHSSDTEPGITRKRMGRSSAYFDPEGKRVTDRDEIDRLNAIGLPPAYEEAWFCADPDGHLQATGVDARGRKQYRYHADWHEARGDTKYARLVPFASALPKLRGAVERDLARPGLPREKVLATVARLLELTLVRIGNDEYTRANGSFGPDEVNGEEGDDVLNGGEQNDHVDGGADNDTCNGGDGNDTVIGGPGDDEINGGQGDDHLIGGCGSGIDVLDGGAGTDVCEGDCQLDVFIDCETVVCC